MAGATPNDHCPLCGQMLSERRGQPEQLPRRSCPACGASLGAAHRPGCDLDVAATRCPGCGQEIGGRLVEFVRDWVLARDQPASSSTDPYDRWLLASFDADGGQPIIAGGCYFDDDAEEMGTASVDTAWPLHAAAERGDAHAVAALLHMGRGTAAETVDAVDPAGRTALHYAVRLGRETSEHAQCAGPPAVALMGTDGHWEVIRLLLVAGARLDILDSAGRTPLEDAAPGANYLLLDWVAGRPSGDSLAAHYAERGFGALQRGDGADAVRCYDMAIGLRERSGGLDPRDRVTAPLLAKAYVNQCLGLGALGDHQRALAVCEQGVALYEALVGSAGRADQAADLAWASIAKAQELLALGRAQEALAVVDKSLASLRVELAKAERANVRYALQWGEQVLQAVVAALPQARTPDARVAKVAPRPASGPASWQPGELVLEEYLVERLLGGGGQGSVYLVRHRTTGERLAVKRTHLRDTASQRSFLAEVQAWIDLPEHPHLTACRFVRTVGDELVVFAEYVAGESLSQWIMDGRVSGLGRALDIAIQVAWGLQAAHGRRLVHQDVKPANVLMTVDGTAKITDFGLARARANSVVRGVTVVGLTPPYCSPEQAAGLPLTHHTDVWSWGLVLLEMLVGGLAWRYGEAAPRVLDHYLSAGERGLEPSVVEVLRRAFALEPANRWPSMAEAAAALRDVYQRLIGRAFPRDEPVAAASGDQEQDRRIASTGATWDDPNQWLETAYRAAGRDVAFARQFRVGGRAQGRGQALADLAVFEEAYRLLLELVTAGRADLEETLARLCQAKALVHRHLHDLPGALVLYDQAIELRNRIVARGGGDDAAVDLAWCYMEKAVAVQNAGDHRAAVSLFDPCLAIYEGLAEKRGDRDDRGRLALACVNKAVAAHASGEFQTASQLCDRAIAVYEPLVAVEGWQRLGNALALAYLNKANALLGFGEPGSAAAFYRRCLAAYQEHRLAEGNPARRHYVALAHRNLAEALSLTGDSAAALSHLDTALEIWGDLVERQSRRELAGHLASGCHSKARRLADEGLLDGAMDLYDRAVETYDQAVRHDGRTDLVVAAAGARADRAELAQRLGLLDRARQDAEAAIGVLRAIAERTGAEADRERLERARRSLSGLLPPS